MKKIIALLLSCTAAASCLTLCACGNDKQSGQESGTSAATTAAAENKKSSADQSKSGEVDLMKLHGVSDEPQNDFVGAWKITGGEGKQYKSFVYMFDGTTHSVLMTGSVGQIAVYSVDDVADAKGNTQSVFTCQMIFGINGKYTYQFSKDKKQVVLTNIDDKSTTTLEKLDSYEYIPVPEENPKIDKKLVGAWSADDGEMMYFGEDGIMYEVIKGLNFYFATYNADGKKASWAYSYTSSNPKNESAEYSIKGDTLTFNGHDYKRISPSELV